MLLTACQPVCWEGDPPAGGAGELEEPLPAGSGLRHGALVLNSCHHWMPCEINCIAVQSEVHLLTPLILKCAVVITVKAMRGDVIDTRLWISDPRCGCVRYSRWNSSAVIHWGFLSCALNDSCTAREIISCRTKRRSNYKAVHCVAHLDAQFDAVKFIICIHQTAKRDNWNQFF